MDGDTAGQQLKLLTGLGSCCQVQGPFTVYGGGSPSRRLNPCEPGVGTRAHLARGAARAEVASRALEGTLGSDAPDLEVDVGSDELLGTGLLYPHFTSGFQASLPRGLWL